MECSCDFYILCRHGCRSGTPSGEGIAFFGGSCHSSYCSTIVQRISFCFLSVYLINNGVAIDPECPCDFHILCRHGCRGGTPSGEGIALFGGSCHSSYCSTIIQRISFCFLSVYLINNGVAIDSECSCDFDILCRYVCRSGTPSGEGIAFFGGSCHSSYCSTIVQRISFCFLFVYLINNGVAIDPECPCGFYIICRHGGR